ncbi:hypothetical protein H0X48_02765 [Candidatus Dependentiae bacterium]|nr:hypothetical protein [Candidatus Dependentiae bacterium]
MMLDNMSYNKIKIVYTLSDLLWFIEKHAKVDAQQSGDVAGQEVLEEMQKELGRYLERVQKTMCSITQ